MTRRPRLLPNHRRRKLPSSRVLPVQHVSSGGSCWRESATLAWLERHPCCGSVLPPRESVRAEKGSAKTIKKRFHHTRPASKPRRDDVSNEWLGWRPVSREHRATGAGRRTWGAALECVAGAGHVPLGGGTAARGLAGRMLRIRSIEWGSQTYRGHFPRRNRTAAPRLYRCATRSHLRGPAQQGCYHSW